jgi:hypothetical protein
MKLRVHYLSDSRYAEARDIYVDLTENLGVKTAAPTNLGSAIAGCRRRGPSAPASATPLSRAELNYKKAINADKNYASLLRPGPVYMDAPSSRRHRHHGRVVRLERAAARDTDHAGRRCRLADERIMPRQDQEEQKARKKKQDAPRSPRTAMTGKSLL